MKKYQIVLTYEQICTVMVALNGYAPDSEVYKILQQKYDEIFYNAIMYKQSV